MTTAASALKRAVAARTPALSYSTPSDHTPRPPTISERKGSLSHAFKQQCRHRPKPAEGPQDEGHVHPIRRDDPHSDGHHLLGHVGELLAMDTPQLKQNTTII